MTGEKVRYCDVSWKQLVRIKEYSVGENILVRFQHRKRLAWLACGVAQKNDRGDEDGDEDGDVNTVNHSKMDDFIFSGVRE